MVGDWRNWIVVVVVSWKGYGGETWIVVVVASWEDCEGEIRIVVMVVGEIRIVVVVVIVKNIILNLNYKFPFGTLLIDHHTTSASLPDYHFLVNAFSFLE